MIAEHERLAAGVHEPRALAAERLREQKSRRVLRHRARSGETGRTPCRRCGRRRDTPARRRRRSPLPGSSSPRTPGRPRRWRAASRARTRGRLAARVDEPHAQTSAVFDDGAHRKRVLQHADARDGGDALPEHASDLAPRGIRRVQHAAHAVRAFGCERRLAVGVAIEPRAPVDQLARIARPFVAEDANGALVAEAVARDHRVGGVQFGRIVFADRRGDAALRVLGVAFVRIGFRDDDDVAGRRQLNRRAEPRDSAADDYEVAAYIHRGYTTAHIAPR